MTPHLSEEQVASYRDRSLAAAQLLQVSQHLAECQACRSQVASESEIYTGIAAFRLPLLSAADNHLAYAEIAAYAGRELDAEHAAAVDLHVRTCRSCAAGLAAVQSVRQEMQPESRWFARLRQDFAWKGAFALAGAAACALLLFMVFHRPAPEMPVQQARAPQHAPLQSALIHDGSRTIGLDANGAVTGLEDLPPALRSSLTAAISRQRLEPPAILADLSRSRGVLMGPTEHQSGVELVAPLGIVVESQQPVLRWKPVPGAGYQASVFAEGFNEVAASGWITDSEWQVTKPLSRGKQYSWQLNVRRAGREFTVPSPPAPEARFRVLDAAGESDIARIKSGADGHFLLGIAYARVGALDDAARELKLAREQNPESSAVAAIAAGLEQLRTARR